MPAGPHSDAIVFEKPGKLSHRSMVLTPPEATDLVVDIEVTGISSGTEKMLWQGTMPAFPGLGYPLVPGYEAVGTVRKAGSACQLVAGSRVFVPGASCYPEGVRGLFGASASTLVVPEVRVTDIGSVAAEEGALLALAATAMHALTYRARRATPGVAMTPAQLVSQAPELIIGHGVLGRLLARLCLAVGANAPVVWEIQDARRAGAVNYDVIDPADDTGAARQHIVDVSGACGDHFNRLIACLGKGGQLTLAGFYSEPVNFDFAPAFMREANLGIAAEWVPDDLNLVMTLLKSGNLQLNDLVSHQYSAGDAGTAYPQAFDDPACLKTILHWSA